MVVIDNKYHKHGVITYFFMSFVYFCNDFKIEMTTTNSILIEIGERFSIISI